MCVKPYAVVCYIKCDCRVAIHFHLITYLTYIFSLFAGNLSLLFLGECLDNIINTAVWFTNFVLGFNNILAVTKLADVLAIVFLYKD